MSLLPPSPASPPVTQPHHRPYLLKLHVAIWHVCWCIRGLQQTLSDECLQVDQQGVAAVGVQARVGAEVLRVRRHQRQHLNDTGTAQDTADTVSGWRGWLGSTKKQANAAACCCNCAATTVTRPWSGTETVCV